MSELSAIVHMVELVVRKGGERAKVGVERERVAAARGHGFPVNELSVFF